MVAVLVGTVLSAVSAIASAQHDQGLYLGGSWGVAQYKDFRLDIPSDDRDPAWRFFGGYQFNRSFSAELGFADLGAATGHGPFAGGTASVRQAVKAWDLSGMAAFPLADRLSILVRLGIYRARTTEETELSAFPQFNSHDAGTNSGWIYGAGLGYDLGRLGLRAEWQRYGKVGVGTTGENDIDVGSIGLLWRF